MAMFMATLSVSGQNIMSDVIEWEIVFPFDKQKDSTASSYNARFITNGKKTIDWIQNRIDISGEITTEKSQFTVNKATGSWMNVAVEGTITFDVSNAASAGTFTVTKRQTAYLIQFTLKGKYGAIDKRFDIKNFKKL